MSADWQEGDRLLAGLMTAFGARTRAIPIDGIGRFDGVLLGAFRRPRIEGRFVGDEIRAFGVTWGQVDGDFVVENQYAHISRAAIVRGPSRMDVSGQFSLGFPRADGGEELDARVRIESRPMQDFLDAFDIEDYDVDGRVSGDFHLYGDYTRPLGFGRLSVADGTAYGEPFTAAEAALRFEGAGPAGRAERAEGRDHGRWRGLRRVERLVLVQRGRPRHVGRCAPGDDDDERPVLQRALRLLGHGQRHVRGTPLRREVRHARPLLR
ncbi:MAG: hypothetical protein R2712_15955 [Vicinamibacterales bacterium]